MRLRARFGWPLHDRSGIVSDALLEERLELIRARVTSQLAGVFGPSSMTGHETRGDTLPRCRSSLAPTNRSSLGRRRRLRPLKALTDPVTRFHRTFKVVFTMVFGTVDRAFAAARSLHHRHESITGVLPETVGAFEAGPSFPA